MSLWSLLSTSWVRSQRFVGQDSRTAKQQRSRQKFSTSRGQIRLGLETLEDRTLLSSSLGINEDVWQNALVDFYGEDLKGKDGRLASVGFDLGLLYHEYQAYEAAGAQGEFVGSNSLLQVYEDYVLVDVAFDVQADTMVDSLSAMGMVVTGTWDHVASGYLAIDAIDDLATVGGIHSAAGTAAAVNVGSVTSQGDAAQFSDLARSDFGVDGTGITVGILSDSFDALGGYSTDIATGDLPNNVNVLSDYFSFDASDEGRAMAQLVADVAPGADLAFHTAFNGQADFASGIVDLANAGSDVIVDDVFYFAEPFFQDGIIAQAVDQVVGMGVSYYSSAGNSARSSYESEFRNSGIDLGPLGTGQVMDTFIAHDFDEGAGVDVFQTVTFPFFGSVLSFQWDDAFYSVSGGAGAQTDMDIAIFDMSGNLIQIANTNNIGGDAYEILAEYDQVQIAIGKHSGVDPTRIKYIVFDDAFVMNEYDTASGTSVGHSNAAGAESVGAAYYADTPAFGTNPPGLEYFSSAGGTPILFDTSGNRLATPEIRNTPDIVAPDGGNTTFFGSDAEGDGYPNFFGTSAAAPHAAAVSALLLEASGGSGSLTPDEQYDLLESTAIDMDDPSTVNFDVGFDYGTGFGLIDAHAAVQAAVLAVEAPPVADAGGPYVFGIQDVIQLDGSKSSDRNQPDDTLTYMWDFDLDGIYDATGIRPEMSVSYLQGQSESVVRLKVIDNNGTYDTDLARVYLDDTAVLRIRGDYDGVVGQRRVVSLKLYGNTVTKGLYTYTVDWGDGSKQRVVTGISGLSISKIYNKTGTFTISATAVSNETGLETSYARNIRIGTVQQQGDDFAVTGTNARDEFRVVTLAGTDRVEIFRNRISLGVHRVPGTIYAIGLGGDDWFRGDRGTYDVYFDGGHGNNVSYTYYGDDTILGRDGNDRVYNYGGDNYVSVGNGDNVVKTNVGDDYVMTGYGDDRIIDFGGNNEIYAGDGDNAIDTRKGNDLIVTGSGQDEVNDLGGNNYIEVGNGSNVVSAGIGSDTILGGDQDDSFRDDGGLNYIFTFAGNDFIVAFGTSYVNSGLGSDFVFASNVLDDEDDLFDLLARAR